MALAPGQIYQGDCVVRLHEVDPASVDLAFADPPFNIGYEYDVYEDRRQAEEYLSWCRLWMQGIARALKPTGSFWLAIGDEFAAELKLIAQRELGMTCRSWVIWYYTFGVNCVRNFTRSHTHLLYFVKDARRFKFNASDPAIRVPSARQLVYADKRANPKGRLPDNTWILRPQDLPAGFSAVEDTWYYSRVAGTFKERAGFHGCQMPEQLLGRIIRACSDETDIVLDPFTGSGTTLTVAKKLRRRWLGFELSPQYAEKAGERIRAAKPGQPLDGPADPVCSAPPTPGRTISSDQIMATGNHSARRATMPIQRKEETERAIVAAFKEVHQGFSTDRILADAALNQAFSDVCRAKGIAGAEPEWNRLLLRLRKSSRLPGCGNHSRLFSAQEMDPYSFASEIALAHFTRLGLSLDDVLCDPRLAAEFDQIAARYSPGFSSLQFRWAALWIRKRARKIRDHTAALPDQLRHARFSAAQSWSRVRIDKIEPVAGIYLLLSEERRSLYLGEAFDLRRRLEIHGEQALGRFVQPLYTPEWLELDRRAVQTLLIDEFSPTLNYYNLVCQASNKAQETLSSKRLMNRARGSLPTVSSPILS
jgi:DNA modification methylase